MSGSGGSISHIWEMMHYTVFKGLIRYILSLIAIISIKQFRHTAWTAFCGALQNAMKYM
jgi:hypothetical protein